MAKSVRSLRYVLIALLAVILVLAGSYGFFVVTGSIYPGVRIDGISVAFQSQRDVAEKLNQYSTAVLDRSITVLTNNKMHVLDISEFASVEDPEQTALLAYQMGRTGSFVDNFLDAFDILFHKRNIDTTLTIDEDKLRATLAELSTTSYEEPTARQYVIKDGYLVIDGGAPGSTMDIDKAVTELTERIRNHDWSNYSIPYKEAPPPAIDLDQAYEKVTTEAQDAYYDAETHSIVEAQNGITFDLAAAKGSIDLNSTEIQTIPLTYTEPSVYAKDLEGLLFRDTLASTTTYFSSWSNRGTNIKLCAASINGTVVQPGEVFSFNDTRDEATEENGYKMATIYSNGQSVPGIGGGICQVSSTLYVSALKAGMETVERHNHMFTVSYLDISFDATVFAGSLDYRFENTSDYPVRIEATTSGGALTIKIMGTKTDDTKITLSSKKIKTDSDYMYAELYKTTTKNGESVTVTENTSRYRLH